MNRNELEFSALGDYPKCDHCGKDIKPNENVVQTFAGVTAWITYELDGNAVAVGPPEMAVYYDKVMLVHVDCKSHG